MLAGAVDALEGLFMLQANQAVVGCVEAHLFHGEQVLVDCAVGVGEQRGKLVLSRSNLVVLGLCGNTQSPQVVVDFLHELVDGGADCAEVMLFKLLALKRCSAEQGAARHDKVLALYVVLFGDQEVLLLCTNGGNNTMAVFAEELQNTLSLLVHRVHGTKQRGLLVECLAGVRAECGGDAQHLILDEGIAGGVPSGVAASLEGCAQAAGGEARCVGLALDKLLAAEGHDGGAIANGVQEAVVLFGRDAGKGLEPVRVMGGAVLDSPFLHSVSNDIRNLDVERLTFLDGFGKALERCGGKAFLHDVLVEHHRSVDFRNVGHLFSFWVSPLARLLNGFWLFCHNQSCLFGTSQP